MIRSLDRSGALTRERFGEVDLVEHFWFRARLVTSLASNAAHTVLFPPRPDLQRDMAQLVGIDITAHPERHTIVAEGVDPRGRRPRRGCRPRTRGRRRRTGAIAALRALVEQLAPERRGLPLIVSLGRLHRVKGMATLVERGASGPLRDRANLVIIGGELEHPSLDEREQLDRIHAAVPDRRRDSSSPATARTASRRSGSPPRDSGCRASAPRVACTCARA